MIDDQLARSRAVIGLVPKARIEVRRVPEFKEKTAPGAYYSALALDGTRPGIFYANLRDMAETPRFRMRTVSIHEGVPRIPPRRLSRRCFSALVTGWAIGAAPKTAPGF